MSAFLTVVFVRPSAQPQAAPYLTRSWLCSLSLQDAYQRAFGAKRPAQRSSRDGAYMPGASPAYPALNPGLRKNACTIAEELLRGARNALLNQMNAYKPRGKRFVLRACVHMRIRYLLVCICMFNTFLRYCLYVRPGLYSV